MNKNMMFTLIALTAIVVASSFDLQLMPHTAINIPSNLQGTELYVCPANVSTWDSLATGIRPIVQYVTIGFFFITMILIFMWGWELYQNLLKDKFNRDGFKKPWEGTKLLFWTIVIFTLLTSTPNHFRTVHVVGATGDWVLCENNSPGARAIRANAVR